MSVILVSSDLDELCEMSDRVLILRRGQLTHELAADLSVSRLAALMHEVG
jgi:ABC-type sugar transport system ATPase subunit